MKKYILSLIVFMSASFMMFAQDLYVAPSSYMYVQDEIVFVTNDVRIEDATANIYLRTDAQLIQDNNIKNSNSGELSVYQTPTKNLYGYNYWCSPVGVGDGAQGDVPFSAASLRRPATITANEISSVVYPTTGSYNATAGAIATYWLWKATNANSYADWIPVQGAGSVAAGEGFTMKGRVATVGSSQLDEQIDFRGRPNTGTFSIGLNEHNTQVAQANYDGLETYQVQTLVGNPYPSTMDLKMLFYNPSDMSVRTDNEEISEVWFWQENNSSTHNLAAYNGGYSSYVPGSNLATDDGTFAVATFLNYDVTGSTTVSGGTSATYARQRRFAKIGQGFMVVTDATTHTTATGPVPVGGADDLITIDNSMRVYVKSNVGGVAVADVFDRVAAPPVGGPIDTSGTNPDYIAMSHNGIDYMEVLNNPILVPEMRIHTNINDTYYRETVLAFRENTSEATYNKFCDGNTPQINGSDVYFSVEDRALNIKSIAYNIDAKVPFVFKAGESSSNDYSITINNHKNLFDGIEVYMHDKVAETYTDILNDTFEITLDQGVHNDRFEITFKTSEADDIQDDIVADDIEGSFVVFQNNSSGNLMINNPGAYQIKSFTMFDVTGKLIFNEVNLGENTQYSFPTNKLSTGTYVVKVGTENNVTITKKVIIHNR